MVEVHALGRESSAAVHALLVSRSPDYLLLALCCGPSVVVAVTALVALLVSDLQAPMDHDEVSDRHRPVALLARRGVVELAALEPRGRSQDRG
jgi:hypothetical protein